MIARSSTVISLILLSACVSPHRVAPPSDSKLNLLNPQLAAEPGLAFDELRPFEYKVKKLIAESRKARLVSDVAVYFRDMENGPVFGLDANTMYTPASLMKVPLMMAVLKEAESNPALLSHKLRNDQPEMARSDFNTHALTRGAEYTVDELVRAMIASSDNDAVVMLRTVVADAPLNEVFRDFGLIIPEVRSAEDSMSVREYAAFFRILYNASYLNKAMSQKALEYLAASEFKQALADGVPPGVIVAHKFGERSFDDKKTKQLHDCGIVYHPAKPYVLCVMTRGDDFDKLASVIKNVSAMVYKEVDSQ